MWKLKSTELQTNLQVYRIFTCHTNTNDINYTSVEGQLIWQICKNLAYQVDYTDSTN